MCRITSASSYDKGRHGLIVDASGARRAVSAELIDELDPGDYVMVHAGMAIAKITDTDDHEMDDILEDL